MDSSQSSFYSFLMEPMVDLEPGVEYGPESLASFNNELEQSMEQIHGSATANTEEPKETALKDKNEIPENSNPAQQVKKTAVKRRKMSLYQKLHLENEFQRCPYPSQAARAQLSYNLGLSNSSLVNWFKKRRYRWRREHLNAGVPVTLAQPQVLGQHLAPPQDTCPGCYQVPLATAACQQESQQVPVCTFMGTSTT